ncbi:unnamed protein product [Urochloa humidicola]
MNIGAAVAPSLYLVFDSLTNKKVRNETLTIAWTPPPLRPASQRSIVGRPFRPCAPNRPPDRVDTLQRACRFRRSANPPPPPSNLVAYGRDQGPVGIEGAPHPTPDTPDIAYGLINAQLSQNPNLESHHLGTEPTLAAAPVNRPATSRRPSYSGRRGV